MTEHEVVTAAYSDEVHSPQNGETTPSVAGIATVAVASPDTARIARGHGRDLARACEAGLLGADWNGAQCTILGHRKPQENRSINLVGPIAIAA